jgi:hypothetical protein
LEPGGISKMVPGLREVRDSKLVSCADIWDALVEYALQVLKRRAAETRWEEWELADSISSGPLDLQSTGVPSCPRRVQL